MFLSSVFILGLITLAVPLWVHRLRVHAADRRIVSSLMLMRASAAPINLQKKLQHRWLMALRMAMLLLAVFAFSQPMIDWQGGVEQAVSTSRVIVLDTSLSMARDTVFEDARRTAEQLIAARPPGTRVGLLAAADTLTVIAPLTADDALLNASLRRWVPGAGSLAFDGLMVQIDAVVSSMAEADEAVEVHLISDFQASAMPARFNGLLADVSWPVVLQRVGEDEPNWAIESLRFQDDGVDALTVDVRGFATHDALVDVVLEDAAGEPVRQAVRVPANGFASVAFAVDPDADRWTARLDHRDVLAADDQRYIARTLSVDTVLPVVAKSGRALQYFTAAATAANARLRPVRVAMDARSLGAAEPAVPLVALIDPGLMSPTLSALVSTHLRAGGAVFMTAGPDTRAAGRLPIVDVVVAGSRFDTTPRGVVAVDRSHPVLGGSMDWHGVSLFQRVVPEKADAMRVLLAADDGAPVLVEYRVGGGRLLVLLTALDPEWSSLVVQATFVEFVARLMSYLTEDTLPSAVTVGAPVTLPALSVQILDPAGNRVLGLSDTVERPTVRLATPGLYQLRTPGGARPLAVNVPSIESPLEPAADALLVRWQQGMETGPVPHSAAAAATVTAVDLAPYLLLMLFMLAMMEPLIANLGLRWGMRGQAAP